MSTGANCYFEERSPGKWYYCLQRWPYGETPDYDEEGPFRSQDVAREHLHAHYSNPGGAMIIRYEDYKDSIRARRKK